MHNATAAVPPIKAGNVLKRAIHRHQHKIVWIGAPLLGLAVWGMAIAGAMMLWR